MTHPLAALRTVVQDRPVGDPAERCDMCSMPILESHRHVVDTSDRSLKCLCQPCFLLFSDAAAAHGRYRQVPDRYRRLADVAISAGDWEALQIPVSLAFFFENSDQDRIVAFYPGPAGATESLLPLDAWSTILADNPLLGEAEADVEAVLVRQRDDRTDCYLVPIDVCYELVGRLRMHWSGFDGGAEAHDEIQTFFARVEGRSGA